MDTKKEYYVYKHTTPSNKVYIGITCQSPKKRWGNGCNYKQNKYFYCAIKKYTWENIKHEILFNNLTKEEAEHKEIELIKQYKSNDRKFGYNIENGGNSVGRMSEETKRLISKFQKGRKPSEYMPKRAIETNTGRHLSEETKRKISESNKGKKISEKQKLQISLHHKGKKLSEEHKKKISEGIKKSWTEERRKKFGEMHKGNKCIFYGKVFTPEEIKHLQDIIEVQ